MAVVFVVYIVGSRIPLPGLDTERLIQQAGYSSGFLARLSIFALGIVPFFSVLVLAEIAKLAIPPLARWQMASEANANRLNLVIVVMALLMAGLQAYGIMVALETSGLAGPDAIAFVPVGIACLVGGVAVLIWIAHGIELPNRVAGFWLLLAIPFLSALPPELVSGLEMVRIGATPAADGWTVGLYVVAAVVLAVYANGLLSRRHGDGDTDRILSPAILLWPPFLASAVAGYVVALVSPFVAVDMAMSDQATSDFIWLVSNAVLMPFFVWAYARVYMPPGMDAARKREVTVVLAIVAAIQLAICVGADLFHLYRPLPLDLDGTYIIVVVTVMLTLVRFPAREAAVQSRA
ncbi:preprotein translocase subunit SecY [Mesorhizobium sp. CAU 1732]|uniref:preprotein translocase subunit SecY n=1 Tax=Mesorhizobium sp. CAU 1732 TaxID=3140358 RepID=UPI003261CFB2